MSTLNLQRLRYFAVLADELHFGRAATRLHIAQPALSQQIRKLEEELGVALFRRSRRAVELTDAGRLLVDEARTLLADAERIAGRLAQAGAGLTGRLRIGFVGSASYSLLPAVVLALRDQAPDVELVLHDLPTSRQIPELLAGRLDAGFVRPPVDAAGVALAPLVSERLVVALPAGHARARSRQVTLSTLADQPFVHVARGGGAALYDDVLAACLSAGFRPDVVQESNDMHVIVNLVAAGIGVALVPESVRTFQRPGVVYRPLRGPGTPLTIGLATRAGDDAPLVARLRTTARAVARAR